MKGGRLLGLRGEVTVDATIARAVNTMRVFQLLDLLCKPMLCVPTLGYISVTPIINAIKYEVLFQFCRGFTAPSWTT